jgi:hypothetical protein
MMSAVSAFSGSRAGRYCRFAGKMIARICPNLTSGSENAGERSLTPVLGFRPDLAHEQVAGGEEDLDVVRYRLAVAALRPPLSVISTTSAAFRVPVWPPRSTYVTVNSLPSAIRLTSRAFTEELPAVTMVAPPGPDWRGEGWKAGGSSSCLFHYTLTV